MEKYLGRFRVNEGVPLLLPNSLSNSLVKLEVDLESLEQPGHWKSCGRIKQYSNGFLVLTKRIPTEKAIIQMDDRFMPFKLKIEPYKQSSFYIYLWNL